MDMTYNHMPTWLYTCTDLSFSAKLIMQRLFTLSKDGLQQVFVKRADIASQLGASIKTITRGFKELLDYGVIQEEQNPNKYDRVRYFSITQKAMGDPVQSDPIGLDQNAEFGQNVPTNLDKMSLSNWTNSPFLHLDRSKNDLKNDFICEEKQKMTNEEIKEWLSVPVIDEPNLEPVKEVKAVNAKEATATTTAPLTMERLPTASVKKKSSAKRKTNNNFTVPSYAEVVALMSNWAKAHADKYPVLLKLDAALEAEGFMGYWESVGWHRKAGDIKSLNGTIAAWLVKNLKEGKIAVKPYNPAQDYRRTGLTREMNQEIANNIVPKAIEFAERLKQAEQQQTPRRHVDEIEQLENEQFKKLGVL